MTKEWLKHRTTILGLYKDQSKTLDEVRRIMREEYGFEASVRAYRSRFDKWRVHKYNCARRRAATVTVTSGYEQREEYLLGTRDGHLQRPHADGQFLPMTRHYSAPDVLTAESDTRPYSPVAPYSQPGIKFEPHVDNEASPRTSAFGGEYTGQPYRPWFGSHTDSVGDATHDAPNVEGVVSPPPRMLLNSGLPVRADNSLHQTEQLHWTMHAIQLPLQQHALELLLQCLAGRPDVTRVLPNGEAPFSRLAIMFCQQLASDGTLGTDNVWELLSDCLRQCLSLGADPDVLVGDKPLLFHILEQPARTRAFGLLWPLVWHLATEARPTHRGRSALHALLDDATPRSTAPTEATARAHLTKLLISRAAAVGRLGDRNARGLTALEQYVYRGAAHDPPEHVLAICAELVRLEEGGGGGASAVVPPCFADDMRAGRLQAGASLLPVAWVSACQQSMRGDRPAVDEHLPLLLCCIGRPVDAESLRAMLPRPAAAAPLALPSPVSPRNEVKYAW
ncbi:hypothetical protein Daus18300_006393 [Diaporthe australafricana]|uniref:Clr5 domain-containing protein n=1 Tax=Diaporthe australafricana TaxID=127596 RepID=A0ABR3WVB9_9PEZI